MIDYLTEDYHPDLYLPPVFPYWPVPGSAFPPVPLVIVPETGVTGGADTSYSIRIYDPFGKPMPDIPSFSELEVAQAVGGVGSVTFSIPGDYAREYLQKDGIITIHRAPRNRPPYLLFNKIYFLRRRVLTLAGGSETWQITAYCPNYLLASPSGQRGRVVAYDADSAQAVQTDFADDMLKAVMRQNVGTLATDTARDLSAYLDIQADTGDAPVVQKEFSNRVLLPTLNEICRASETAGTYLAWDIICTQPPHAGAFRLEFQTFVGQRGQDHRATSGDAVQIGTDFGNLDNAEIDDDWTEEENYIRAGGQDNGAWRLYRSGGDVVAMAESPFNRRETFIDLSNVSDPTTLDDEIDAALKAGVPKPYYSGALISSDQTMFDVDWGFGDYLTAQAKGRSFEARVDALVVLFNSKGEAIKVFLNGYNPSSDNPIAALQKQIASARKYQEAARPKEIVSSYLVPPGGGGGVSTPMIALFDGPCPTGWTEYTASRGRAIVGLPSGGTLAGTVGSALTDLGTKTISTVVSHLHAVGTLANAAEAAHTHGVGSYDAAAEAAHTHSAGTLDAAAEAAHTHGGGSLVSDTEAAHLHAVGTLDAAAEAAHTHGVGSYDAAAEAAHTHSVDPPSTQTTDNATAHAHQVNPPNTTSAGISAGHHHVVNPPSTTSAAGGSHTHDITTTTAGAQPGVAAALSPNSPVTISGPISTAPTHTHAVDIAAFDSSDQDIGHTHAVDIAAFMSAGEDTLHSHTLNVAAFTSAAGSSHDHALSGNSGAGASHDHALSGSTATGGSHSHTISGTSSAGSSHDHALSGSVGAGSSHDHALSGSSGAGASHNHTLTGSTATTGTATVDVTMPYIQLRLCQKN